jgi:hypothetical protein
MRTLIAVTLAAMSLVGSTIAMAQPYRNTESGYGPPRGTQQDRQQQLNDSSQGNGF